MVEVVLVVVDNLADDDLHVFVVHVSVRSQGGHLLKAWQQC